MSPVPFQLLQLLNGLHIAAVFLILFGIVSLHHYGVVRKRNERKRAASLAHLKFVAALLQFRKEKGQGVRA